MADPESKIKAEVLEAHGGHEEFTTWCKTQSSALTLAVETGSEEKADLEASLVQIGATRDSVQTKISDPAGSAATTEAELKATTAFRAKEREDFAKLEQELGCQIDTLARAVVILEKEMKVGRT